SPLDYALTNTTKTMEFAKILTLRGPNVWANFAVLEAWIDLGPYNNSCSNEMEGCNERIKRWLPSMVQHRCSVGEVGGFFQRLDRGTYPAHILEHVAIELQCLCGADVGFGRARAIDGTRSEERRVGRGWGGWRAMGW